MKLLDGDLTEKRGYFYDTDDPTNIIKNNNTGGPKFYFKNHRSNNFISYGKTTTGQYIIKGSRHSKDTYFSNVKNICSRV